MCMVDTWGIGKAMMFTSVMHVIIKFSQAFPVFHTASDKNLEETCFSWVGPHRWGNDLTW